MSEQPTLTWQETAVAPAPTADAPLADAETQALIARCLGGDEAAYALLYQRHSGLVYRLAYSLLQHHEDAEEVLQDSFEYAFRTLKRYDPRRAAFTTWLYRITVSRCRNKRRRKWLPTFSLNQSDARQVTDTQTRTPDEALALTEAQRAVWEALQQLSPRLRETAVLRTYYGLRYSEIGEILDIPAKTAESRMRLAHKALRDMLETALDG